MSEAPRCKSRQKHSSFKCSRVNTAAITHRKQCIYWYFFLMNLNNPYSMFTLFPLLLESVCVIHNPLLGVPPSKGVDNGADRYCQFFSQYTSIGIRTEGYWCSSGVKNIKHYFALAYSNTAKGKMQLSRINSISPSFARIINREQQNLNTTAVS